MTWRTLVGAAMPVLGQSRALGRQMCLRTGGSMGLAMPHASTGARGVACGGRAARRTCAGRRNLGTTILAAAQVLEADTLQKKTEHAGGEKKVYIETYGCQMNVNDTEVILGLLQKEGYEMVDAPDDASVIFLNTCAIREKAEARIWGRLRALDREFRKGGSGAVVGILGCMAERLKEKLLDKDRLVDIVAGPDAYRDLPNIIDVVRQKDEGGSYSSAINVQLSVDETYADITPVREAGAKKAFITIIRGCNNMCAFCIVPFTRGRERSRPISSIVEEVRQLSKNGVKEVTLLGQNVNSYADFSGVEDPDEAIPVRKAGESHSDDPFQVYAKGFKSVYKPMRSGAFTFAQLLEAVAQVDPEMRIRFTSPHPKDFSDDVLDAIARYPNICKQLHMPAQSGSTTMLERMKRGYTREAYLDLIKKARERIPGLNVSSDFIAGFCGETEEEHLDTVSLLEEVQFEQSFIFAYSLRDKTYAARHLNDDVPLDVKKRRLNELIDTFRKHQSLKFAEEVGRTHAAMVEGFSKRSKASKTGLDQPQLLARTCTGKKVVFTMPDEGIVDNGEWEGKYVAIKVDGYDHSTLRGQFLEVTTLVDFHSKHGAMSF